LRPVYGLVESGRLWQLAIEKWIFARDLVVVPGASQVFVLRQSGTLKMFIVKVVDDILVCGPPDEIQAFNKDLSRTYKLNPLRTGSRVRYPGMNIVTDNDGSTTIDIAHYLAACSDIPLSAQRRKQQDDECTPDERTAFRTLCGKLSYLGTTEMPQASYAASHPQQRLAYLRVSDLCEENVIMRNLRSLKADIRFQNPSSIARVSVLAYSDAAHFGTYGQGGYLAGLCSSA
jgi:hypothetical protein